MAPRQTSPAGAESASHLNLLGHRGPRDNVNVVAMVTRRELAAALEQELLVRGVRLKPGAAAAIVNDRIEAVADQMRVQPRSAMRYFSVEGMNEMAKSAVRGLKEHEAAEHARPDTLIGVADAALFVSVFSIAARVSVLNGDPDATADLCEALTEIGLALRDPPANVSTAVLSLALERAAFVVDELAARRWVTDPEHPLGEDADGRLTASLQADLEKIRGHLAA